MHDHSLFIEDGNPPTGWHTISVNFYQLTYLLGVEHLAGFPYGYRPGLTREDVKAAIARHFDNHAQGSVKVYLGKYSVGADMHFQHARDAALFKLSV